MSENKIPRISKPGQYHVQIRKPYWSKLEPKDGDDLRMACILPGYAIIDGQEQHINAELYFTRNLVTKGNNRGKSIFQLNAELLVKLGISAPFCPSKIGELDNANAVFDVQEEEYKEKKRLKVAFVNPPGRPELDEGEAAEIWAKMTENQPTTTVEEATFTGDGPNDSQDLDDDDEIPF